MSARAAVLILSLSCPTAALAQQGTSDFETVVTDDAAEEKPADLDGRAQSTVTRADFATRLPRSTPDALRYEPGVFIQQTAHGQGSPFIRGLTGQQTLILFDGIRLNNSTFRQGPNQYFFTLDSATIDEIAVLRGGASTRYGSDALGGVILTRPLSPTKRESLTFRPTLALKASSADLERGGRLQGELATGESFALLGGVGLRRVGLLQSAGPVTGVSSDVPADVPRFAEDGRTQLGTGFDELTADARAVWRPRAGDEVTVAGYVYRQYDAPRTDQCPPFAARFDECLLYEEQFRTLVYGAWAASREGRLIERWRSTVSWQLQHERRRGDRPASFVVNRGEDDVHTFGATVVGESPSFQTSLGPTRLGVGAETYFDVVRSAASVGFTDIDVEVPRTRGQYLDGSTYLQGGAFVTADAAPSESVTLRTGGRLSWITARAPADQASGSAAVDGAWFPLVGFAGVEWRLFERLALLGNVDRSFRAPNLDDLTSRQQTGPGFQFENAALRPEKATTVEAGARFRSVPINVDLWVFQSFIDDAILRAPRDATECPPNTPQCQASWSRFQLVNATDASIVRGVELATRFRLPASLRLSGTLAWTFGEGPNPVDLDARVPLSRIPPLNGTGELSWMSRVGLGAGLGVRWAAAQTRLALQDLSDARIPLGGTPGFTVVDARLWYRWQSAVRVTLVGENLFDAPYRYHGSSVNGPGRGVILGLEASLP